MSFETQVPAIGIERRPPLPLYQRLELGIGVPRIDVLFVVPYGAQIYVAGAEHGLAGILLRGAVGAVCLLPSPLLMGATLPAIARWSERLPQSVSWLGFFYGANICGAVFGCLLAGFYLLRVHDMATATYVAATVNGTVAVIGFGLAALTPHCPAASDRMSDRAASTPDSWWVYVAIALSGVGALGAEVIWTRLLSLVLGPTV